MSPLFGYDYACSQVGSRASSARRFRLTMSAVWRARAWADQRGPLPILPWFPA